LVEVRRPQNCFGVVRRFLGERFFAILRGPPNREMIMHYTLFCLDDGTSGVRYACELLREDAE
jgi:hypothetical protein